MYSSLILAQRAAVYVVALAVATSWLASLLLGGEPKDSVLYVKKIVIEGNETTKNHVILREMSLKVGSPLTPASLEYDQKRIYSLQLFNRVDIDYIAEGDQATVYVRVSERWYIFPVPIIGFKYRDLKNLFYGAALVHQNFRGRNEKIIGSFALGFDRWISLAYQNPKITDDDDIFFGGYIGYKSVQNQNVGDELYNQRVFTTNLTFGKRFGLFESVLGTVGYEQWNVSDPREGRTASHTGHDKFLTVSLQYYYDTRDIKEYASNGTFLMLSMGKRGFGEGEVDLFRYGFDLRGYTTLGEELVLGGRTFGSFLSGGVAPNYQHAYFGYDERIRGHFHTVLEGEHILGSNFELRLPIISPRYLTVSLPFLPPEFSVWRYGVYAGVFADIGTTWYRTKPFNDVHWYSGYGAGLHFLLPYSVIVRTEYAISQTGKGEFVLDFGTSF